MRKSDLHDRIEVHRENLAASEDTELGLIDQSIEGLGITIATAALVLVKALDDLANAIIVSR